VTTLPNFPKDLTDRNRTSPFAFTGNKFEFRMVGSSQSLAGPNVMLNTTVADVLDEFSARIEDSDDVLAEISEIVKEYYRRHRRVVFNGNGYAADWIEEAKRRGLPNFPSTVSALQQMTTDECVALCERQKVFTRSELESRLEIYLETYSKQINIEAGVMVEMARRLIVPAANRYLTELLKSIAAQKELSISSPGLLSLAGSVSQLIERMLSRTGELEAEIAAALSLEHDIGAQAQTYLSRVVPAMAELRFEGDSLEKLTDKNHWPYPSYEDMLFRM
jgi:glutamine synthetase